jgi:hypothetical protein
MTMSNNCQRISSIHEEKEVRKNAGVLSTADLEDADNG